MIELLSDGLSPMMAYIIYKFAVVGVLFTIAVIVFLVWFLSSGIRKKTDK